MASNKLIITILFFATFLTSGFSYSQSDEDPAVDDTKAAETDSTRIGIPDENIDIRTGAYYWETTDVTLPGVAGLDMKVIRSWNKSDFSSHRHMANWELEIPRVQQTVHPNGDPKEGFCETPESKIRGFETVFIPAQTVYELQYVCETRYVWDTALMQSVPKQECGYRNVAVTIPARTESVGYWKDWYSGMSLIIPGLPPKPLLKNTGSIFPSSAKYITADNWVVKCIVPQGDTKKNGYTVTSPDGTIYKMDVMSLEKGDKGDWNGPWGLTSSGYAAQVTAYASQVTDKNGNFISYIYKNNSSSNGRWGSALIKPLLEKMTSSDGREISLIYTQSDVPYVKDVVVNGVEWSYDYTSDGNYLEEVILPDSSKWRYFYNGPSFNRIQPSLLNVDNLKNRKYLSNVITPIGLDISYEYDAIYSDYFGLRGSVRFVDRLVAIKKRTAAATDIENNSVTFSYSKDDGRNVTTIGGHRRERHEFKRHSQLLGSLRFLTVYDLAGNVLEKKEYVWSVGEQIGVSGFLQGPHTQVTEYRRNLDRVDIKRGGGDSDKIFSTIYQNYDDFGRPGQIIEIGTLSRRTDLTYFDKNTYDSNGKWINGIPKDQKIYKYNGSTSTNLLVGSVNRIFNDNGLLTSISNYGVTQEYEYYGNGEVKKQKFKRNLNNTNFIEVNYKEYKFGTPQREEYPDNIVISRIVDNFGRIKSETDADGIVTANTYDSMGRLESETIMGEAPKVINWSTPKLQHISKNNYRENNTFDSMGRLILSEKYDSDRPAEKIYVRYGYDKNGNKNFESMPSAVPAATKGQSKVYDLLGRIKSITNTVDGSTTSYYYGAEWEPIRKSGDPIIGDLGFGVVDPRGYKKVYQLDAFGSPNNSIHKKIYEQVSWYLAPTYNNGSLVFPGSPNKYIETAFTYDELGNKKSITQGGFTRSYTYYSGQPKLLHTVTHPETGITRYSYDGAGNKISQQVGFGPLIIYEYDDNNRLQYIHYPEGTDDVDLEYYPSGKLKSIDNNLSRWDYVYTTTGRLKSERLSVVGDTFNVGYNYTYGGDLNSITYPNGEQIDLNADAFGRARKVGNYVSNVNYHPDGFIASYKYRNGHTTYIDQDAKGFIDNIRSGVGDSYSMHHKYEYDKNGNVNRQIDMINSQNGITMGYDGLNRLQGANSDAWGSQAIQKFNYDDIGNITSRKLGSTTVTYTYDSTTNRLNSMTGGFAFGYDTNGNVTSNGKSTFIYDAAGHLVSVNNSPNIEYIYDGHGHRVASNKMKNGVLTEQFSVYTKSGSLLHRKDPVSGYTTNYFYLGHRLVASNLDCSSKDTDSDSIPDCVEDSWGLNKSNAQDARGDLDGDGLLNIYEYAYGLNPKAADSDSNGLSDLHEVQNNYAGAFSGDVDGDGLSDYLEFMAKSDPLRVDTDGDGKLDGVDTNPTLNEAVLVVIIRSLLQ